MALTIVTTTPDINISSEGIGHITLPLAVAPAWSSPRLAT
jgi:hypothetical protein